MVKKVILFLLAVSLLLYTNSASTVSAKSIPIEKWTTESVTCELFLSNGTSYIYVTVPTTRVIKGETYVNISYGDYGAMIIDNTYVSYIYRGTSYFILSSSPTYYTSVMKYVLSCAGKLHITATVPKPVDFLPQVKKTHDNKYIFTAIIVGFLYYPVIAGIMIKRARKKR